MKTSAHALLAMLLATLPTLAAGATGGPDSGDPPRYAVRYILFQHMDRWDDPLSSRAPAAIHDAPKQNQPDSPGARFDELWEKLKKSPDYRPLRRDFIVPYGVPEEDAEPRAIDDRWPASIAPAFAALENPADRPVRATLGDAWLIASDTRPMAAWGTDRIRGALTFYKGRYAHLEVDLLLIEERRWMPWGVDRNLYHLHQDRRMLPDQLYYFDHPRFGLVVEVREL